MRLSATELAALDALAAAGGATRSAMLRQVLGSVEGFVVSDPGLALNLAAALGQLRGSATNLNQPGRNPAGGDRGPDRLRPERNGTRAANRGAPGWGAAERSAVAGLTRDIGSLSRAIADLQAATPRRAAQAVTEPAS